VLRGNAAEPHEVTLTRQAPAALEVTSRTVAPGTGLIRVPLFGADTAGQIKAQAATLTKSGATRMILDLRGTAVGEPDAGLAAARLFVPTGTLAFTQARGQEKAAIEAATGDGAITAPIVILTDHGTSGAAELFASAL